MIDLRKMTKVLLFGMFMLCLIVGGVALYIIPEIRRTDLECVELQEAMMAQTNLMKVSLDEMKSLDLQGYKMNSFVFRQDILETLDDNFKETLTVMRTSLMDTKKALNRIDHYAFLGDDSGYLSVFNTALEIEKNHARI